MVVVAKTSEDLLNQVKYCRGAGQYVWLGRVSFFFAFCIYRR